MKIKLCKICTTTFSPEKDNGQFCSPECRLYTKEKLDKMFLKLNKLRALNLKNNEKIYQIEAIFNMIKYNAR